MANIWSHLRGKKTDDETRFDVGDYPWAGTGFTGNDLMGIGTYASNNPTEKIGNDFVGYVQGAYKASGVVFAACAARMLVFSEMRFVYQKLKDGRATELKGSNELAILENPWPNGTTGELLSRAIQDADMAGNNYVVKEGVGKNARLRRLRPDWVSIALTAPPDKAVKSDIVAYIYKPGNTEKAENWEVYPIDGSNGDIAHWAPYPDPEAQYRGMSWLTAVLREIQSDKQATKHKLKFFENAATPNIAVSFDKEVTAEQFEKIMDKIDQSKSGVDNAYKTLYLGGGANVEVIGANVQQMDFKSVQGMSETRICAAARVPVAIVGLSEGTQGSSLNEGNMRAAKDIFADGTLRPLWRSLCAAYSVLVPEHLNQRLWYDMRDIAFLRHDQKEIAEIRGIDASTMAKLIMNGFTPESIVLAIENEDWLLLEHTGLYSVQLQPPLTKEEAKAVNDKKNGTDDDPGSTDDSDDSGDDANPASDDTGSKTDSSKADPKGVKKK